MVFYNVSIYIKKNEIVYFNCCICFPLHFFKSECQKFIHFTVTTERKSWYDMKLFWESKLICIQFYTSKIKAFNLLGTRWGIIYQGDHKIKNLKAYTTIILCFLSKVQWIWRHALLLNYFFRSKANVLLTNSTMFFFIPFLSLKWSQYYYLPL